MHVSRETCFGAARGSPPPDCRRQKATSLVFCRDKYVGSCHRFARIVPRETLYWPSRSPLPSMKAHAMDTSVCPRTSHAQRTIRLKGALARHSALYVPRETLGVLGSRPPIGDTRFSSTRIFWLIDLKSIDVPRGTFSGNTARWIGASTRCIRGENIAQRNNTSAYRRKPPNSPSSSLPRPIDVSRETPTA